MPVNRDPSTVPCFQLLALWTVSFCMCQAWYAKTPMGKKRAKAALADDDDVGSKGKGKGKKGKGKGKGKKKGKKKK